MNTTIFEIYDSESGEIVKTGTADTLALYLGVSNSNIYARAKTPQRSRYQIRRSLKEIDYQTGVIIEKDKKDDKLDYIVLHLVKCKYNNCSCSFDPVPYFGELERKYGLICEVEKKEDLRMVKNCNVSSKRRHHGKYAKKGKPHYIVEVIRRNGLQNLHS